VLADESVHHRVPDEFEVITERPAGEWRPLAHGWRVLPHDAGTDGMILVRYRKRS
jgi:16S rRNA (cytosine967-C5)-methyltransferase